MKTAIRFSLIGLLGVLLLVSCVHTDISLSTPAFRTLPDGAYLGNFDGGIVKATVLVHMVAGVLQKIDIVTHECGLGKPAEKIVDTVVAKQSLDVDTITGATYSSRVILKATEIALDTALASYK